jgi:hypothetical protein
MEITTGTVLAITFKVLLSIPTVIKFCEYLSDKINEQNDIKSELESLITDFSILRDTLSKVNQKCWYPEGVQRWVEEASNVVSTAEELLEAITEQIEYYSELEASESSLDRIICTWVKPLSKKQFKEMKQLKTRIHNVNKHGPVVLLMIRNIPSWRLFMAGTAIGLRVSLIFYSRLQVFFFVIFNLFMVYFFRFQLRRVVLLAFTLLSYKLVTTLFFGLC